MSQRILFLYPTLKYALVSFCFRFQTGNNEEAENESYPFTDLSDEQVYQVQKYHPVPY